MLLHLRPCLPSLVTRPVLLAFNTLFSYPRHFGASCRCSFLSVTMFVFMFLYVFFFAFFFCLLIFWCFFRVFLFFPFCFVQLGSGFFQFWFVFSLSIALLACLFLVSFVPYSQPSCFAFFSSSRCFRFFCLIVFLCSLLVAVSWIKCLSAYLLPRASKKKKPSNDNNNPTRTTLNNGKKPTRTNNQQNQQTDRTIRQQERLNNKIN